MLPFVRGEPVPANVEALRELTILSFLVELLYFSLLEGFWGASLGKAVCGLRVVGPERQTPGFLRAFLRSSVFLAPNHILSQVFFELGAWTGGPASILKASILSGLLEFALVALLFSTARRRNGFAGVHELLSKTRVILRSAYEARPMTQIEGEIAVSQPAARRLGPYEVLGSLRASQEHELLAGYDERLRRKVWINLMPAGSPAVTNLRRDLSRAGRLRWLSGKRTGEDCWDAYEAFEGKPLLAFLGEPQLWRTVRHWLHDLAEELHAALQDKSAPDLGLDRVWITADGRAKLLEWPAPGLDRSLEESSLTAHEPCDFASAQRFLYRVALCALQGCMNQPGKEPTDLSAVPLPLQATSFLKKLGAQGFQTSQLMVDSLISLVRTAAVVPRWRRCAQLAFCVFCPLLIVNSVLMGKRLRSEREHSDLTALTICLMRLEKMQQIPRESMGEEALREKKALEIFVATRYPKALSDPSVQSDPLGRAGARAREFGQTIGRAIRERNPAKVSNPFAEGLMLPERRALAERLMAAHPNPTEEEIRQSAAVLDPLLRRRQERGTFVYERLIMTIVLFPELVLGLLSALLFRGGLLLRWLGIAVVTRDGMEVSRSRALWRSMIAWSPCAAVIVVIPIFFFFPSSVSLSIIAVLLAVSLIGVVAAAVNPQRGLQDRLAGTYLVPR